jgi:TM2 domain-containing membrane protein YozV
MNLNNTDINESTKKSPAVAMIWSVVYAGFGQFYNGDYPKGGAFTIGAIIGCIVFWPLWVILAMWSIYDAHRRAVEINQELTNGQQAEIEKKNKDNNISLTRTKVKDFIIALDKFHVLHKNNLLTDEEYHSKISELIIELSRKRAYESSEDFLTALIPLVSSGALNTEEISKIKSLIY